VSDDSKFAVCVVLGSIAQLIGPIAAASSDDRSFFNAWNKCCCFLDSMSSAIFVGTILALPGLYLVMVRQSYYELGYTMYQLGSTMAVQPYCGVVPKLVSPDYEGRGSGIMVVYTSLGSIVGCVLGILIGSDVISTRMCGWIVIVSNFLGALFVIWSLLPFQSILRNSKEQKVRTLRAEVRSFVSTFGRESLFRTLFLVWGLVSVAQYVPLLMVENDLQRNAWDSTYQIFSHVLTHSKETSTSICTLISLILSFLSAAYTGYLLDMNERLTNRIVLWGTCIGVLSLVSYGIADLVSSFELVLLASSCSGIAQGIAGTALWSKTVSTLRSNEDSHYNSLGGSDNDDDKEEEENEKKTDNFSRDMSIFWLATLLPQILIPPLRSLLFFLFDSHETAAFATTWFVSAGLVAVSIIPVVLYIY
jgi:hypothetical protein